MPFTMLVPRGAEARAVRSGAPSARIVPIAAARASAHLPEGLDPSGGVILLGLCGSLGAARVGDVVSFSRAVDASGAEACDAATIARVAQLLPELRDVVGATVDRVVTRAAERAALGAHFGAGAVDMEGTHVARALRRRGVELAIVRVVSDDPAADLPPIEDAFASDGTLRPFALASAFARAPVAAARFVRNVQVALGVLRGVASILAASK